MNWKLADQTLNFIVKLENFEPLVGTEILLDETHLPRWFNLAPIEQYPQSLHAFDLKSENTKNLTKQDWVAFMPQPY